MHLRKVDSGQLIATNASSLKDVYEEKCKQLAKLDAELIKRLRGSRLEATEPQGSICELLDQSECLDRELLALERRLDAEEAKQ